MLVITIIVLTHFKYLPIIEKQLCESNMAFYDNPRQYECSFIPESRIIVRLSPNKIDGLEDEAGEIARALTEPIGTNLLSELVLAKKLTSKGKTVIVVNDLTRPTPSYLLVPPLLDELNEAGVEDDRISLLVATGSHSPNDEEELRRLLSEEVLDRIRIVNHDGSNSDNLVDLGKTPRGVPVVINKEYYEADVKILTGSITPHQSAGFSGGRKSVLPGIAGKAALRSHHSYPLRVQGPAMGVLSDNHFSEEAMAAARMAGVDFILNVVQNGRKQIVRAVAGDLESAWLDGVAGAREIFEVKAPRMKPDLVISFTGGPPRDINLYQAQKSISPAEKIVRDGGMIIVVAECGYGIGGGKNFFKWLAEAERPVEVIERFKKEGYHESSNKAYLYARALNKAEIVVVTPNFNDELMESMFLKRAETLEDAFSYAEHKLGKDCTVAILENTPELIPVIE